MRSKGKKGRPPRFYKDQKGRYIRIKGKKIYINSPLGNQQLVKVIVNNFLKKSQKRKTNPKKIKKIAADTVGISGSSESLKEQNEKS